MANTAKKSKRDPYAKYRDADGFIELQLAPGAKLPIGVKGKRNKFVYQEPLKEIEYEGKYTYVDIGDYIEENGIIHAMNMNVGRSIPWIEDGLKSVERRVLYTMFVRGWKASSPRTKVDSVVGAMIDLVYPHGDQACDTIYRLGRETSTMIPYIDGKGSYGDIVTMRPAAARYAEARLSQYAMDCFFSECDVKVPIYDLKDNYKYDNVEPVYLPTKYPNILMNWNMGIGNGAYAGIAAFNPTELLEATIKLLDDPDAKINIYPDCPVAVDIVNKAELKGCFDKYQFSVKLRGQYHTESQMGKDENGRKYEKNIIVFTSCPMNTHGKAIEDAIVKIKTSDPKTGKRKDSLAEIIDVHPATAINPKTGKRDGNLLELSIEYENGYDPNVIAEKLFKMTPLATTIPVKHNMIFENRPEKYTPRKLVLEWIKIRFDEKRRYFQQKVRIAAEERTATEALLIIFRLNKIDQMIDIIRKSKSDEETIRKLSSTFPITDYQASVLANKRLKSLNVSNVDNLKAQFQKACDDYDYYRKMCEEKNIKKSIREDLEDGIKKYGRPRRARLLNLKTTTLDEADESKVIIYNHEQYYCLPKYDEITTIANKIDKSYEIAVIKNSDAIALIGTNGKMKRLDGFAFGMNTNGVNFSQMGFTSVARILPIGDKSAKLAFITKHGYGKIMPMSECSDKVSNGRIMKVNSDDELIAVTPIDESGILGMVEDDKLYYLNIKDIPVLKKASAGNRLVRTKGTVNVSTAIFIPSDAMYVLIYGESGYAKVLDTTILVPKTTRKSNSVVNMGGKSIYHVIPIDTVESTVKLYTGAGKKKIDINIDKKITFSIDGKSLAKTTTSTSIAAPTKVFKVGKHEFYRIR